MRRGREGHKNNELGREEGTPKKEKQDKAGKAEQTTEYTVCTEREIGVGCFRFLENHNSHSQGFTGSNSLGAPLEP